MNERAFLLNIIENPKEDGPRLVFSDWLEEQGEGERAEFIRLQCELAKCYWCKGTGKRIVKDSKNGNMLEMPCCVLFESGIARKRCEELLRRNEDEWIGKLGFPLSFIHRGFISEVSLTEADFLSCAPQLCWHPIEKVNLTGKVLRDSGVEDHPRFIWWNKMWFTQIPHMSNEIEAVLWNHIENYHVEGSIAKTFLSKEKALVALQDACLSYLNSLRTGVLV